MPAPADMTRQGRYLTWNKHKTSANSRRQRLASNTLEICEDIGAGYLD